MIDEFDFDQMQYDAIFPAKITAVDVGTEGYYEYQFKEAIRDISGVYYLMSDIGDDGRAGVAREINNQYAPVGTIVWMRFSGPEAPDQGGVEGGAQLYEFMGPTPENLAEVMLGALTTTLPAGGFLDPGEGTAAVWQLNTDGSSTTTGETVLVYNPTDRVYRAGTWVNVYSDPVSGKLWAAPQPSIDFIRVTFGGDEEVTPQIDRILWEDEPANYAGLDFDEYRTGVMRVRMRAASTANPIGGVTNTDQQFDGLKYADGWGMVSGNLATGRGIVMAGGAVPSVSDASVEHTLYFYAYDGNLANPNVGYAAELSVRRAARSGHGSNSFDTVVYALGTNEFAPVDYARTMIGLHHGGQNLDGHLGDFPAGTYFFLRGSDGTLLTGDDGTDALGNVFVGGICTTVGSGTISVAWSSITGTPTTLAGYGITDGATDSELAAGVATAETYADGAVSTHSADTTGVHGITDTADLGLKSGNLSQFAATTSAQLATLITDETGSGALVFAVSPALTGTPTAPTATAGTNTTQIATTAFVTAAVTAGTAGALLIANNLSDVASASTAFGNIKQAATTSATGVVELATDGETAANVVVQGNDSRLSDARTPVGTALASGKVWVGSGSNVAAAVSLSGIATLAADGTLSEVTASINPSALKITGPSVLVGRQASGSGGGGTITIGTALDMSSSVLSVQLGTSSTTACAGDDSRLSDARTPVGSTLTSGKIWVGSGSNVAAAVTPTGSGATISLSNAGVFTISAIANASLTNSSVTLNSHTLSLGGTLSLDNTDIGLSSVTNDAQTKASIVPNTAPSSGQVLVGNGGGTAYAKQTISGSGATITMSALGVVTISAIANASLSNSSITLNTHAVSLGGSLSLTASDIGLGSVTNDAQTKAAIVPNTAPAAGEVLVGNAGGTAYAKQTISGSGATITLGATGVVTISAIANASLSNSSVTVNGTAIALGASGTVTAAAGTLTGTTLASGVVTSSLTTVGTLVGGATGAGFTVALTTSTITGTLPAANLTSLTGLTGADPALADELAGYDASATANRKFQADRLLALSPVVPGGRLTGTSGVSVTPLNVSGVTSLKYAPHKHNGIQLYDGTRVVQMTFAETTLALGTVVPGAGYDVFGYLSGGVLTLESLVWKNASVAITNATPASVTWTAHGMSTGDPVTFTTSGGLPTGLSANVRYYVNVTSANLFNVATTLKNLASATYVATSSAGSGTHTAYQARQRQTALAYSNGLLCKSGDATRLYLGSFCPNTTTAVDDSDSYRGVFNAHWRVPRSLKRLETTSSANDTTTSWKFWLDSETNKIEVFRGLDEETVRLSFTASATGSGGSASGAVGIRWDTVGTPADLMAYFATGSGVATSPAITYDACPGLGSRLGLLHQRVETNTVTFYGFLSALVQGGAEGHCFA